MAGIRPVHGAPSSRPSVVAGLMSLVSTARWLGRGVPSEGLASISAACPASEVSMKESCPKQPLSTLVAGRLLAPRGGWLLKGLLLSVDQAVC